MRLLLDAGADKSLSGQDGFTALMLLVVEVQVEVQCLLKGPSTQIHGTQSHNCNSYYTNPAQPRLEYLESEGGAPSSPVTFASGSWVKIANV